MSFMQVVFRVLNKAGNAFIEPRREDGHGSAAINPTFVNTGLDVQTDALTNTELRASDVNVADSGEREYPHLVRDVTSVGDTTILTPALGKRIRLHWIYAINDPTASTACKIKVRFGSNDPIYNVWALSKRQLKTGGVNEPLIVNLSANADIAFTIIYEEVV